MTPNAASRQVWLSLAPDVDVAVPYGDMEPSEPRDWNDGRDKDGWPKRWSDPTYLGDGPWGA